MKKQDRFSWEKVTLSELQCSILLVLIRDNYPFNQKAFAKRTGGGISGVSKALNELERKGLVVSFKQDIRAYMLNPHRTEEIKKFITGYDLGKNKPFII
jgi:predicted transcriptional regulator